MYSTRSNNLDPHPNTDRRLIIGLLAGLLLATAMPVWGAPIQVTTTAPFSTTECTLKNAVSAANAGANRGACVWSGHRTIQLSEGTYDTAGALPLTINAGVTMTIKGDIGGGAATLSRQATDPGGQFFKVKGALTLQHVTLTGGSTSAGGAINVFADGALTVYNCRFLDNSATSKGGAIHNRGTLDIEASTFDGNSSGYRGGAVYLGSLGSITIKGSTFVDNSSDEGGAVAIYASTDPALDLVITNSTFSNNDADWGGALAIVRGSASVDMSTFKDNTSLTFGSAIAVTQASNASATLRRSALDWLDSPANPTLCDGPVISHGDNTAEDDSCDLNEAAGDEEVSDVLLTDNLLDHGGLTDVHVPLRGSPLIDAYLCVPNSRDQRDLFDRDDSIYGGDSWCDVGAYESICSSNFNGTANNNIMIFAGQSTYNFGKVLNNGACSSDQIDFGTETAGCSIQWNMWGIVIEFQSIWFLRTSCLEDPANADLDCISDPEACRDTCAFNAADAQDFSAFGGDLVFPTQTLPTSSYKIEFPNCDWGVPQGETQSGLRYVVEFANGVLDFWDPEIVDPNAECCS